MHRYELIDISGDRMKLYCPECGRTIKAGGDRPRIIIESGANTSHHFSTNGAEVARIENIKRLLADEQQEH